MVNDEISNKDSKLPQYYTLVGATFKALKELSKPSGKSDIDNKVAEILGLSDEVIQSEHVFNNGRIMTRFEMYMGFCRSWLKDYGAITNNNNLWDITRAYQGIDFLSDDECKSIANSPHKKPNSNNFSVLTVDEVLKKFDVFIKSQRATDHINREQNELSPKHKAFLHDFPNGDAIRALSLDEYCFGKNNRSFCNRIETDLNYGEMNGVQRPFQLYNVAFDMKTCSYFAKNPNSRNKTNDNKVINNVFAQTKESIARLIESIPALNNGDYTNAIKASSGLNKLFVGRILFVYDPENQTPVYSLEHLNKFLSVLNPSFLNSSFLEKKVFLANYFKQYIKPHYQEATQFIFMEFLYSNDGLHYVLEDNGKVKNKGKANDYLKESNSSSIQNQTSNITMREIEVEPVDTIDTTLSSKTSDDEDAKDKPRIPRPHKEQDENQKTETGKKGEEIVCSYLETHNEFLGDKIIGDIVVYARTDDGIGFDICFNTENKGTVYVDVKSSINIQKGSISFFMSANEYETMIKKHESRPDSYYICFVDDVYNASEIRVIRSSLIIGRNVAVTYSVNFKETQSI